MRNPSASEDVHSASSNWFAGLAAEENRESTPKALVAGNGGCTRTMRSQRTRFWSWCVRFILSDGPERSRGKIEVVVSLSVARRSYVLEPAVLVLGDGCAERLLWIRLEGHQQRRVGKGPFALRAQTASLPWFSKRTVSCQTPNIIRRLSERWLTLWMLRSMHLVSFDE